jgi:hypothetical protein
LRCDERDLSLVILNSKPALYFAYAPYGSSEQPQFGSFTIRQPWTNDASEIERRCESQKSSWMLFFGQKARKVVMELEPRVECLSIIPKPE